MATARTSTEDPPQGQHRLRSACEPSSRQQQGLLFPCCRLENEGSEKPRPPPPQDNIANLG